MSRYRAFFALMAGLILAANASAQEERFRRSANESFAVNAEEDQRPIVSDSGRFLDEDNQMVEEKKSGFPWISLPKPKLPALPKPSMPKLSLPTWGSSEPTKTVSKARKQEEPSTWEKLNSGTKNLYAKTKRTLMPWTADDEKSTARSKSQPARRTARSTSSKSKTEKKPFFSSWLETHTEEKPVETVNDYLALPRVQY
jgi:hypothetical protein